MTITCQICMKEFQQLQDEDVCPECKAAQAEFENPGALPPDGTIPHNMKGIRNITVRELLEACAGVPADACVAIETLDVSGTILEPVSKIIGYDEKKNLFVLQDHDSYKFDKDYEKWCDDEETRIMEGRTQESHITEEARLNFDKEG